MDIFKLDFSPPQELETEQFHLFPTRLDLFESDYLAVMKSRELLRIWSQSTWPEDDFTPEQNREDLQLHVQDNVEHVAYGYMIYTADRAVCLGSLYVNPLTSIPNNYVTTDDDRLVLGSAAARVDCWVAATTSVELETHIIETVKSWFAEDWKIDVLYAARSGMVQRLEVYEALSFRRVASLHGRDTSHGLLLYA